MDINILPRKSMGLTRDGLVGHEAEQHNDCFAGDNQPHGAAKRGSEHCFITGLLRKGCVYLQQENEMKIVKLSKGVVRFFPRNWHSASETK
jgi:hypothetical protein